MASTTARASTSPSGVASRQRREASSKETEPTGVERRMRPVTPNLSATDSR